ncbi:exosortase K [Aureibacter tunicatorum]|uniref:Exosortase K n=1 Tax=Aureibacter tunicatorum TaxID=866807 RepID=A0AAE3XNC2_9BACT|nr:exosortase K [Aureibacter tunicatorum]BDD05167.1 hypothetical protein AUTU_26500 [Aureibacter tunicatorum]
MEVQKNIFFYFIIAIIFIILKLGYTQANNDNLVFLLKPTDKMVGILSSSTSIYHADQGYYHEKLNILIDKSCSGFNFWLISFLLFNYLSVKHFRHAFQKALSIPLSLFVAYLLTLFANTSRIYTSIIIHTQSVSLFPNHQQIIHECIGIITNLTFLIITYLLLDKLLTYNQQNAKFS